MRCAVLADRHHGLSEAIRGLLEEAFEVIVMVADEQSLVGALEKMQADIAVVDLSVSQASGLHMLNRLRTRFPSLKLVAMSGSSESGLVRATYLAGADGFVSKIEIVTELIPVIETIVPAGDAGGTDPATGRGEGGC